MYIICYDYTWNKIIKRYITEAYVKVPCLGDKCQFILLLNHDLNYSMISKCRLRSVFCADFKLSRCNTLFSMHNNRMKLDSFHSFDFVQCSHAHLLLLFEYLARINNLFLQYITEVWKFISTSFFIFFRSRIYCDIHSSLFHSHSKQQFLVYMYRQRQKNEETTTVNPMTKAK